MVEPLSIIGFIAGQIGFILLTIPEVNKKRYNYVQCRQLLTAHRVSLAASESKLRKWKFIWECGSQSYEEGFYRFVWSENYNAIRTAGSLIEHQTHEINTTMQRIITDGSGGEFPLPRTGIGFTGTMRTLFRRCPQKHEIGALRRVAFALSTNTHLRDRIGELDRAINDLEDLCQNEYDRRVRGTVSENANAGDIHRLNQWWQFFTHFTTIAQSLYEDHTNMKNAQLTSTWAAELRRPEETGNIKEWDQWEPIDVDFSFCIPPAQPKSNEIALRISHHQDELHVINEASSSNRMNWQEMILGQVPESKALWRRERPRGQRCRSYGDLFKEGYFDNRFVFKAWQRHRAELVYSLCNWALLLWDTNWTANLCSFGLCYVCRNEERDDAELNTFTIDRAHSEHCYHVSDKLKSLGITLAELITTTLIRPAEQPENFGPVYYQMWSAENQQWHTVSEKFLIREVHRKSLGSTDLRDAIRFCITASVPQFEVGYLLEYIIKVYEPVDTWCKKELKDWDEFPALQSLPPWSGAALEEQQPSHNDELEDASLIEQEQSSNDEIWEDTFYDAV
ncbi:hypothetical protein QQS21_004248 [Conoideocrella luteorostrata]|uniref:Uncharacterized protein n=1 Tax=Conoideocrella luteorostrata TaxID=1105319 RepID=A0AAJ0G1Q4_9HYPO|nr:hypothetical protein QQS21_004248 [Conoideocrella luteorostrata]